MMVIGTTTFVAWAIALAIASSLFLAKAQDAASSPLRRHRRHLGDEESVKCPRGYKLDGYGYCVVYDCYKSYTCPDYSHRAVGRDCYNDFDDCECDHGYYKKGYYCEKHEEAPDEDDHPPPDDYCDSDYHCPSPNWKGKDDVDCYHDIDDCDCAHGYKLVSGCCVEISCKHDYKCPSNSKRKLYRKCYDDFGDCSCNKGYTKLRSKCIKSKY